MIAAVAATLSALPAAAQWYAGAGIGRGSLGVTGTDLTGLGNAQVEDTATVWSLNLGYKFHPNFAIEAGYGFTDVASDQKFRQYTRNRGWGGINFAF